VAALRGSFSRTALQEAALSPIQSNPAYQPPQPVISSEEEGSDIDTDPWHFRKKGADGVALQRADALAD